jgi:hypothetical protein
MCTPFGASAERPQELDRWLEPITALGCQRDVQVTGAEPR